MRNTAGPKLWRTYLAVGGVGLLLGGLAAWGSDPDVAFTQLVVGGIFLLTLILEAKEAGGGKWWGRLHAIPLLILIAFWNHRGVDEAVLSFSTVLVFYLVYRLPQYASLEYRLQARRIAIRSRKRLLQAYLCGLLLIGAVFVPWRRVAVIPDGQDFPLTTSYHPLFAPPEEGDLPEADDIGRFYRTELVVDRYASALILWNVGGGILIWMAGRPPKEAWKGRRRDDDSRGEASS